MEKKYLFIILLVTISLSSFGQTIGDFRSVSSGTWISLSSWETWNGAWITATSYPGQLAGTNTVTIQEGNTITIGSNLATFSITTIIVKGILTINPTPNPNAIDLDTQNLIIDGGTLNFSGVKAKLNLVPTNAVLSLINNGTITAAPCSNNYEIFINSRKYAACAGGGSGVFTFGEVAAAGGNVNAKISSPVNDPVTVSGCMRINLEGGYDGTETNVTYQWKVRYPNGSTSNLGPAGILANSSIKTLTSFTPTTIGEYLVSLEITTAASATNIETRTFNVVDTNPTIIAPLSTTGTTNSGCTSTNVSLGTPITNNNCSAITVTNNAPAAFPIGTTTVTWTATDASGRTATSTQTVTVVDSQNPTIATLAAISVNTDAGVCSYASSQLVKPTAADNCGVTSIVATPASLILGANTVTWTATDGSGRTATSTQTVTVVDSQNPTIATLSAISVNADSSTCSFASSKLTKPSASDNCTTVTVTCSPTSLIKGPNTVTWTASDASGNTATSTQIVTVVDNQVPTIATLSAISVNVDAGVCTYASSQLTKPTAADNCSVTSIVATPASLILGANTVTWTATDGSGGTATSTQTVTVVDSQNPTIATLSAISVNADAGVCTYASSQLGKPTAADNCSVTSIVATPASLILGANTVTWTATDGSGRTATSTQTVTVVDSQNPTIATLSAISVNADAGVCTYASSQLVKPTAADNCMTVTVTCAPTSLVKGPNTVTWTASDASGNTATSTQTVTVVDNQVPTIATLSAISVNADAGVCTYASSQLVKPTAADNCSVTSIVATPASLVLGANTVTWTATDGSGRTATSTQTVTVVDSQNPAIICPANVFANTNSDGSGNCTTTVSLGTPTASDNCTIAGNLIIVAKVGGVIINPSTYLFATGNTTVVWTAKDQNGNVSAPCNQTVSIIDNEAPTAANPVPIVASGSAPPPDITLVTSEADNCTANPVVSFVSDTSLGSCPVIVTRIYKVSDNAGNSINVTQKITVNDAIKPIARCIADNTLVVTLDGVTGKATILASQINNGSTDNCGTIALSLDKYTFGCNDVGVNTVKLTVTDSQGNADSCFTKIRVDAPTINSGTLTGYNVQTQTAVNAAGVIEITACPVDSAGNTIKQDVTLTLKGIDSSLIDNINRWEYSTNGGVNWTTISGTTNTTTTYTVMDVQVTTLVRAVIDVGDCKGFSPIAIITVIPPDIPPNIVNGTQFNTICLGASVAVVVESELGISSAVNQGGLFNTANLDQLGWKVDGEAEMSAGGDNGKNTYWKETNGPTAYNNRCYNSNDKKFAIVAGIPQYVNKPNDVHIITPLSTLETPVFSTLGLTTMQLEFDQAYYLEAGAWIKIEISTDGGTTYSVELDPGATYDYTGPSSNNFTSARGCVKGASGALVNDNHVAIDLQAFIGLTNLRIRFSYWGTLNSAWAIDNIRIPNKPIDEVIQWTDDSGVVVATGSTVSITPVTPGIQNYGATSLINGCRSNDLAGTEFINIDATLSYAGKNIAPVVGECGEDTVNLSAYDNTHTAQYNYDKGVYNNNYKVPSIAPISPDYPPTGKIGTWSVASAPAACTGTTSFSNTNDPNATFTGKPGTYTLAWTVNGCASTVQVIINSCDQIDFDGVNDFITFKDNYDRTGPFSLEMWVKAGDLIGTQSLISKRDVNNLASGYDLRLNGNSVQFHWGASEFIASSAIDATTWHHIAVTFNGSSYKLYMDGVEKASKNGNAPTDNSMQCILGAMDQANKAPNQPVNYYHGWIDEVRIWNKALNIEHIRQMMNQEIKLDGGDNVMGEIVPLKIYGPDTAQNGTDSDPLLWSDLDGYYRMDVNCGYLSPSKGSLNGRLRNIYSAQQQTAPLPYKSANDGLWNNNNTWAQPVVWYTPNNTVFGTKIDWNIVQIANNIESGDKDITVLGLISTAGKLTIADPTVTNPIEKNDGQGLWITHYLKLNGTIDLVGESQLVEKRFGAYGSDGNFSTTQLSESILDEKSSGYIERDQQGKKNSFNYNYWSSPVSNIQAVTNNTPYSIAAILRDGTISAAPKFINFGAGAYYADGTLEIPIKISERWIWSYNSSTPDSNTEWNNYWQWNFIQSSGLLKTGEGFTMKGTGGIAAIDATQNYVFVGKPNSGTITLSLPPIQTYLIGNPYPSALDADEFILDNLAVRNAEGKNIFGGALYFWDHFGLSNNHNLAQYEGGYATYTLTGGVPGINNSSLTRNDGKSGLKTPGRHIPVGQAFFVDADLTLPPAISGTTTSVQGGNIVFKNNQRVFVKETEASSLFMKSSGTKNTKTQELTDIRQKIRLGFDSTVGAHRQLLLGADKNSTNLFDIGYDAQMFDRNANDMYWELDDIQLVIQAVPSFNEEQIIPLGIIVANEGEASIKIDALENITETLQIYLYDNVTGIYHNIKKNVFPISLRIGKYNDRFSLRFTDKTLNVDDYNLPESIMVHFTNKEKILHVENNFSDRTVNKIYLYNILGQSISNWDVAERDQSNIKIPVKNVPSGVYIVKLNTTNGDFNKKIIIR